MLMSSSPVPLSWKAGLCVSVLLCSKMFPLPAPCTPRKPDFGEVGSAWAGLLWTVQVGPLVRSCHPWTRERRTSLLWSQDFLLTIPSLPSSFPSFPPPSLLGFYLPSWLKSMTNCSPLMHPPELGLIQEFSFWDPTGGVGRSDLQSLTSFIAFLAKTSYVFTPR